jgi:hypothetical protein
MRFSHLLALTAGFALFSDLARAAVPWQQPAGAVHDAVLGCRPRLRQRIVPVMPPAAEWLQLNLQAGPPFYAKVTSDTTQVMIAQGQQVRQTQLQTFWLQWTPHGRNDQGQARLTMKILDITMKLDIGGVTMDEPNPMSSSPLTALFKSMVGAEFEVTITPYGEVADVEGIETLLRKLSPLRSPFRPTALDHEALKQMAAPFFGFLPRQAVRPGDTWEQRGTFDLGAIGSHRVGTKYTYDGQAGRCARILVNRSFEFRPAKHDGTLPFTILSADVQSTSGKGQILFDRSKGRLASLDVSYTLGGEVTIEVGGMKTSIELRQTQRQRIETQSTPPQIGGR